MNKKNLSVFESCMLIAGSGLGTGILAIPYVSSKVGLFGIIAALLTAYIISVLLHLIVADLVLHSKNSTQLIGIFKEHLFSIRGGNVLSIIFSFILIIVLYGNLTIYISCASEVIKETFNISYSASKIIFYIFSSSIVLAGIKIIGISEKYSMILIAAVIMYLTIISRIYLNNFERNLILNFGNPLKVLFLYGMIMFSFSALFSVPQVVNNIDDKTKIKKAIIMGIGVNAVITFLFTITVLTASKDITSVATIGLSNTMGNLSKIACSIFVILAMLTSYWSISLALIDIICEETKKTLKMGWFAGTVPTLLLSLFLPMNFISYIQIVGGSVAVIIAFMLLPSYYNAIIKSKDNLILGSFGKSKTLLIIIFMFYVLMSISSFIHI